MKSGRSSLALIARRKPLVSALLAGCLALPLASPAQALGIPLTSETIFNFDFTGQPSFPNYGEIDLLPLFLGTPPQSVTFSYYGGFDGVTPISSATYPAIGSLNPSITAPFDSGILDGRFSVGLQSTGFQLSSISALGVPAAIFEGPVVNDRATGNLASVPEPSALALLGIAIAGLGFARRKPRH